MADHAGDAEPDPGWIEYPVPLANANAGDLRVDASGRVWITAAGFFVPPSKVAVLEP